MPDLGLAKRGSVIWAVAAYPELFHRTVAATPFDPQIDLDTAGLEDDLRARPCPTMALKTLGILRISVGLREGLDIEGRVFDVSGGGAHGARWMKRRVEASQPVLSGMFNRAEVTYAWSVRTGPSAPTSSGDREPEQDLGVFGWIGAEGSEAPFGLRSASRAAFSRSGSSVGSFRGCQVLLGLARLRGPDQIAVHPLSGARCLFDRQIQLRK